MKLGTTPRSTPALAPAIRASAPDTPRAIWIGDVELRVLLAARGRLPLRDSLGFASARLLVRSAADPLGFVTGPIEGQSMDVRSLLLQLPTPSVAAAHSRPEPPCPPITVAIATRNRPALLAQALHSIRSLPYPDLEVLIVDNAPSDEQTAQLVEGVSDRRVRYVREPRPGVARARNVALLNARHEIVAFTDDDVVIDPGWLRGISLGFSRAEHVGLVTGMALSGELRSQSQLFFDSHSAWPTSCVPQVYDLSSLRRGPDSPLDTQRYGTGANFAVKRDLAIALGGANEALGAGAPTGGGEDLDLFVRILYAGAAISYEPSAIVWHRHRDDAQSLGRQLTSYATGYSAWVLTTLLDPQMRGDALRRIGSHLRGAAVAPPALDSEIARAAERSRRRGLLSGPAIYLMARATGHQSRPLTRRTRVTRIGAAS